MDLKRLKYFCKVVEQGSVSQAARLLNMAQPPLSKRIQELEEELGVALFVRNGNRIEPTNAGYHMYRRACEILRQVEDATQETIQIAHQEVRVLRIGLTHLFQRYFKPLFLELHRRHPQVELSISVSDSSHLESLLNDGLIDIALIQKPYRSEGYDFVAFDPIKLVAVVSKKLLPEKPQDPFPYLALGKYPLVLLHRARDAGTYEILLDLFRKGGVHPQVMMHITQPGAILDWLESGLEGATLLPCCEVDASQLHNSHVLEVFPSPQIFFPAMVKTPMTPYVKELMEIVSDGYPLR
ncbi:LysR family transcriptional regulator [Entomohabitans teleogrylli]|uniref:LysR substrate-binding domain-containing protein n=1 Tax=Entomohabitans teleogrylli TaxID=1384589 RepID=UPI00073D6481|nr:LysR family transcriptional regulator [Entomohabitans teleogrylli]